MKKVFIIGGAVGLALAASIGTCLGFVFYATSGMVETADQFFAAVRAQDLPAARALLSEEFRASTDEAELLDYFRSSALGQYQEAHWSSRATSGGRGELEGSITTASGGTIPMHLVFVREQGAWRIYSLQKPPAGLVAESTSSAGVPPRAQQIGLVRRSMHDFAFALAARDMTGFHHTISGLWQAQITPQQLLAQFHQLVDDELDLRPIDRLTPSIDPEPTIDERGVLIVTGRYKTHPSVLKFEQKYVYEGVTWKLIGFYVDLREQAKEPQE